MITLEEYKKHLIEVHRYPIDTLPENIQKRKDNLERKYKDEYLSEIINDTYNFILEVLNYNTIEKGYYNIPIEEDNTKDISLNLCGGYSSDTIFKDDQGRLISYYIMKKVFGNQFYIEVKTEENEFSEEIDEVYICGFNIYYSLYMQGFPDNIKQIKEELFGKSKELKY